MINHTINTLPAIRSRCDEVGECWIWRDGTTGEGYPIFKPHGCKCTLVRRAVYELSGRKLVPRQPLMASCGDKRCVNPAHLSLSTIAKIAKKAGARGALSSPVRSAKIAAFRRKTSVITMDIARAIRVSSETSRALALQYGVSSSMISSIRRGDSWRDYSNPFAALMR